MSTTRHGAEPGEATPAKKFSLSSFSTFSTGIFVVLVVLARAKGRCSKHAPKRKAAGGYHTTTTAITKTHLNIASGAKKRYSVRKCCDTFCASLNCGAGARNTVIDSGAFTHALSWVFSRPEHFGFGRDGLVREAGRMAESMLRTSRPPVACRKASGGFQSHSGAETMTKVNSTTTPKMGTLGTTPAPSPSIIARQQAIETALRTALHFICQPYSDKALQAATGRAIRAASMLKQACADSTSGRA
jgi:hypothetical protein